ncbi:MAG: tRNA (guanosine(37)-N1)-methyltransferase TrmD [Pseudomonadota bacterium]
MEFQIVSLFGDNIAAGLRGGVVGRAIESGRVGLHAVNPRDFSDDANRRVDDRPYGGGPGMVLQYAPLVAAIRSARAAAPAGSPVIGLTPQGRPFVQADAERLARLPGVIVVAGRYEGIDERVAEAEFDEELSLGDFVLSGGEIAAMAVVDAVTRLLPGVLGAADSAGEDSFSEGLLDHPHYTRPERIEGREVPPVLVGGDHAAIARWRRKQSLGRTLLRRPDLLAGRRLSAADEALLQEFGLEQRNCAGGPAKEEQR